MRAAGFGHEAVKLIAKDRAAARLQHYHRRTGLDFRRERFEHPGQVLLGPVEKSVIVQWTAAAQVLLWNRNLKAEVLQHLDGSLRRLRQEVVIEGVGPEDDFGLALIAHAAFAKPRFEGFRGECRNLTL